MQTLANPYPQVVIHSRKNVLLHRRAVRRSGAALVLAWLLAVTPAGFAAEPPALPTPQARPFMFNDEHLARVRRLIATEPWAAEEYRRVQHLAAQGDGYWAAFLYALDHDSRQLTTAREWLLKYGRRGGDLQRPASRTDPGFFAGPRPWLGDVYYRIDDRPLIAYDWLYEALTTAERAEIEGGILASARYRMGAVDHWPQTPNLVFKPGYMVALAGLVTGDAQSTQWGFFRHPGSPQGGYFHALNAMLRDGGVWGEAPLYPISHKSLLLMARMSRHLGRIDGGDWFSRKTSAGASPRTLMDYFIDTAYPVERLRGGRQRIRIASYGDGATGPASDLFVINQSGHRHHLHDELAAAYANVADGRYAAFLSLLPDYRPDLTDRPPLPARASLPAAPSKIWSDYGLAMLRSDETPRYWRNPDAIAVLQIMSRGYGHDHRDKFSITLHGAGQLLYPDYNAIQYENPSIGWTRHTIAHNTLTADGRDTRNAPLTAVHHDFSPDVKYLATAASGVFLGVDQTRILMLTRQYLLDVFQARSLLPHRYDYLLHSFGRPVPVSDHRYGPTDAFAQRYWGMVAPHASRTDTAWSLDFVLDAAAWDTYIEYADEQLKGRATEGYLQDRPLDRAAVRVTAAAAADTTIGYGRGRHGLGMLIARRDGVQDAQFTVVHEPYRDHPSVIGVQVLAADDRATVVRIIADDFTDYAAAALAPDSHGTSHEMHARADARTRFAFTGYGWLRMHRDGHVAARGNWRGFRVPSERTEHVIRGARVRAKDGYLEYGELGAAPRPPASMPRASIDIPRTATTIRMRGTDRAATTITLRNSAEKAIEAQVRLAAPEGMEIAPNAGAVRRLEAGAAVRFPVTVITRNARPGWTVLPYRTAERSDDGPWRWSRPRGLAVAVGAVLEPVYDFPNPPVYRVHAPDYTVELDMHHGLIRRLIHADGTRILDGEPLFTLADDERLLLSPDTQTAFTWTEESPAELVAHAENRLRWRARFEDDRVRFNLIPEWARSQRVHVAFPGDWAQPARWRRLRTATGVRVFEAAAQAPTPILLDALELDYGARDWSLCLGLSTPRTVTVGETGIRFSLPAQTRDTWSVGVCPRGGLAAWAGRDQSTSSATNQNP